MIMKFYNTEKIVSKNITEYIINLDTFYVYDFKLNGVRKRRKFEELSSVEKSESVKRKERYYKDKKFYIKRLIDCNYDDKSSFLTITFEDNVEDLKVANNEFEKFMKRLKRYLKRKQVKYINTWEKQKRGSIHFHIVLFDVPFIKAQKLQEIWGNGFIKINKINASVKSYEIGVYLTKYFTKDIEKKQKYANAYSKSKGNLIEPDEYKQKLDLDEINNILLDENVIEVIPFRAKQYGKDEFGKQIIFEVDKVYVILKNNTCKNEKNEVEYECNTVKHKNFFSEDIGNVGKIESVENKKRVLANSSLE